MHNSESVYKHLNDDYSRFLYEKRCMWSLTGDDKFISELIEESPYKKRANELIAKARAVSDKLVVRGVGNEYRIFRQFYPDLDFRFFVDADPVKVAAGTIDGHEVISVDEFYDKYSDFYVLVNTSVYCDEIIAELTSRGISRDHIFNFGELCQSPEQYFEDGIIKPSEHEVFVDGGCYDGTTFRRFIDWCRGQYDKIYAFEPDHVNYEKIKKRLENQPIRDIALLNKGLWNKAETLTFNEEGGQGSSISNGDGGVKIETASIDEVVNGNPVTFIKLDVEGAEYETLIGSEKTIKTYHPRMAISIYHKPEDIFTLPELVLSFSDEYRFYLRHYQLSRFETILYAI